MSNKRKVGIEKAMNNASIDIDFLNSTTNENKTKNDQKEKIRDKKFRPGTKINMDPSEVYSNPNNEFSLEKDKDYLLTEREIVESGGVKEPARAYYEDGKVILTQGDRRKHICQEHGFKLPVIIEEKKETAYEEIKYISLDNLARRQNNPIDIARVSKKMEAAAKKENKIKGRVRDHIAKDLGVKSRTLGLYQTLLKLPEIAQKWVRMGVLNTNNAMTLVRLLENEDNVTYFDDLVSKNMDILNSIERKIKMEESDEIESAIKQIIDNVAKKQSMAKGEPKGKKKPVKIINVTKKIDKLLDNDLDFTIQEKDKQKVENNIDSLIEKLQNMKKNISGQ